MPSKKNSVLIFEPQIFLKKTLTDQNLTFHLKNMKYSAAYFHMTTCGIFLFFGGGRGGVGTLRRSKDVIFTIWATNLEARAPQLKCFWPYLMAFRSCISTGKPE